MEPSLIYKWELKCEKGLILLDVEIKKEGSSLSVSPIGKDCKGEEWFLSSSEIQSILENFLYEELSIEEVLPSVIGNAKGAFEDY
jgi:hypothetical protein